MARNGTHAPSMKALAESLGVSLNSLYHYKRQGCPVKKGPKGYEIEPIRRWTLEHVDVRAGTGIDGGEGSEEDSPEEPSLAQLRRQLLKAQIKDKEQSGELRELKVQIERGEFVHIDEVKKRDVARISVIASALEALPRRLAQELQGLRPGEIETMLRTRFRELRERFARM